MNSDWRFLLSAMGLFQLGPNKDFCAEAGDSNRFINFLGFTFDGNHVFIRPKTISKYYYRMYRKAKTIADAGGYTLTGKHISCKNLYCRYSERGATGNKGNFLSYVFRAKNKYDPSGKNDINEAITRDTKRHMQKIRKALQGRS